MTLESPVSLVILKPECRSAPAIEEADLAFYFRALGGFLLDGTLDEVVRNCGKSQKLERAQIAVEEIHELRLRRDWFNKPIHSPEVLGARFLALSEGECRPLKLREIVRLTVETLGFRVDSEETRLLDFIDIDLLYGGHRPNKPLYLKIREAMTGDISEIWFVSGNQANASLHIMKRFLRRILCFKQPEDVSAHRNFVHISDEDRPWEVQHFQRTSPTLLGAR